MYAGPVTHTVLAPPSPEDAIAVDEIASSMIAQATATADPRILAAHGFARRDISIVHQQLRSANLAWALNHSGRVSPGSVVGVIGGSFSGLMLAVGLALRSRAIVYLFEQSGDLLARFSDKAHRHLSPVLNSRFLGKRYDPQWAVPEFSSPIFAWDKGSAADVAHQWRTEFQDYERRLPIFTFFRFPVAAADIDTTGPRLLVNPPSGHPGVPIAVDLLIDATGFGEEANPHGLVDYSYWEGGHRLIYDHLRPPSRVLLSGCGDSGVIEGLHYAAQGFRHYEVEALWPAYRGLEAVLDQGVAKARLDDILQRPDASTFGVVSEIAWWHQIRSNLVRNDFQDWLGDAPYIRPIFTVIDSLMAPELRKRFGDDIDLSVLCAEAVEDLLNDGVDPSVQARIHAAVDPIAEVWISENLKTFADSLSLPPQLEVLHGMARRGLDLVLNGLTPTAYTRELSPYNVWLMRLLLTCPGVCYKPGRIVSVKAETKVEFEDGSIETFARVVTRYGARNDFLFSPQDPAAVAQDPLLIQPFYLPPSSGSYLYPVRDGLAQTRDALLARPVTKGARQIQSDQYVLRMRYGPDPFPPSDPGTSDPEAGLVADLRHGRCPTYLTQAEIRRVIKTR